VQITAPARAQVTRLQLWPGRTCALPPRQREPARPAAARPAHRALSSTGRRRSPSNPGLTMGLITLIEMTENQGRADATQCTRSRAFAGPRR